MKRFLLPALFLVLVGEKIYAQDTPCSGMQTVTYSGKIYHTVQIGRQCWLKENLDVGIKIDGSLVQTDNRVIEKYCYGDDSANCTEYGGLYQWAEAVQYKKGATNSKSPHPDFTGNIQGICPIGWHIPRLTEFQELGEAVSYNSNALKAVRQGSRNGEGTNTSGFSALFTGYRNKNGNFIGFPLITSFWSSTEHNAWYAYGVFLSSDNSALHFDYYYYKVHSFSVRCVKD